MYSTQLALKHTGQETKTQRQWKYSGTVSRQSAGIFFQADTIMALNLLLTGDNQQVWQEVGQMWPTEELKTKT